MAMASLCPPKNTLPPQQQRVSAYVGGGLHPRGLRAHHHHRTRRGGFSFSLVAAASSSVSSTSPAGNATSDQSAGRDDGDPPAESASKQEFIASVASGKHNFVPLVERVFSDQLTPVLAYRTLVREDDRDAPSFLLESVVNGNQTGQFSFVGAQPSMEVFARGQRVVTLNHVDGTRTEEDDCEDPIGVAQAISRMWSPATCEAMPPCFTGGWVGYMGYDTVRYNFPGKIPFSSAPKDDRNLGDMHLALYQDVVVFDNSSKIAYSIHWEKVEAGTDPEVAYASARAALDRLVEQLEPHRSPVLTPGAIGELDLSLRGPSENSSNMTKEEFMEAIGEIKEHIAAGDVFQLVFSQRFERRTFADPFEIYRALRVVNPSPYMFYVQARGCILVASSPEILCKVSPPAQPGTASASSASASAAHGNGASADASDAEVWRRGGVGRANALSSSTRDLPPRTVVNRPLAGTRKRGKTPEEDMALEIDLLADEKERAEHTMLVDLGRNDVGRVCAPGSVSVDALMEIERYSHVMHISSTVTGTLQEEKDCWDALRAALPVGTISGAPKVRAMQIIDELEPTRRGPYGGGVGTVSFQGGMDVALALRTMVIPTRDDDYLYDYKPRSEGDGDDGADALSARPPRREWCVHIQSGAGVVADSKPIAEYEETVNKAAALARAVDLAEVAFANAKKK